MHSFTKKFMYGIGALAVAGALVWFGKTTPIQWLQGAAFTMVKPFLTGAHRAQSIVSPLFDQLSYTDAVTLMKKNEEFKAQIFDREELLQENERFRRALSFKEKNHLPLEGARVLLYQHTMGQEFLLIDKGASDEIRSNMLVIDDYGALVGTTHDVQNHFSKVILASSPSSTFEAELLPLSTKVVARGLGADTFSIELIPRTTPVRKGDFVMLRVPAFGKSLMLASIVMHDPEGVRTFQSARALLIAQPSLLTNVFILRTSP